MKPFSKTRRVIAVAAVAAAPSLVQLSPASAATGGGCLTTNSSSPRATIEPCSNASNLGYNINSDGYLSNDPSCTGVEIALINADDNTYATGITWAGCSGHVVGPTHYGYGNNLKTQIIMHFSNGPDVFAYSKVQSN